MIYPMDVNSRSDTSARSTAADIAKLAVFGFLLVCVGVFFGFRWMCSNLIGISVNFAILFEIIFIVVAGSFVFRFLVFKEPEKMSEYKGQATDSFARYIFVRKEVEEKIETQNGTINCFEYSNGNQFVVIQLKYGSNDSRKAEATKQILGKIFHIILENNLEFRTIDSKEDFGVSHECRKYINRLNAIPDKKLGFHLRKVADSTLKKSERESNITVLTMIINTRSSYQMSDLEFALKRILSLIQSNITAFRNLEFLSKKDYLEFCKEFYGLEAIDLSMMRVIQLSETITEQYNDIVSVYQTISNEDRVFTSSKQMEGLFLNGRRLFK
jgi:hypothetical protein